MHHSARVSLVLATMAIMTCVTACEFGKSTIALGSPTIVVHAVLNPTEPVQEILVEQALTGGGTVDTAPVYDPSSPIATGGGIPVSGATVIIYTAAGDSAIAREGFPNGGGAGVYLIGNSAPGIDSSFLATGTPMLRFVPGGRYRLRVVTQDGRMVTGATTIPDAGTAQLDTSGTQQNFDRSQDALSLSWPATQFARSYLVQIGTPFSTFDRLEDTPFLTIPGDARNTDARGIPHLFIPGFVQVAIVGAVDSNYYDYVRFRNEITITAARINHLVGGLGVFGAYLPLLYREIQVTSTFTLPIEGHYSESSNAGSQVPSRLTLYVESPAGSNGLAQISGNYTESNGATGGLLGVFDGTHVTLDILNGESVLDTAMVIDGTLNGRTITGAVRGGGAQVKYTQSPVSP